MDRLRRQGKGLLSAAILLFFLVPSLSAIEIDNGIIGDPEVECGSDAVELQFRAKKPFKGKVFVKGHYSTPECRVDYSQAVDGGKPTGGITLHHGSCDMQRQRMISPQGMQFNAVIVVSFHQTFITKIDRAFHIKCMYRELQKTVNSQLEVSMLTTTRLDNQFPMPVCTYTIRKDEIDGPILRYARVGEQVVHRWECQTDIYGMLVHSCYVEDGQGEKHVITDEQGCGTDRYLLGDPTYVQDLNMAYRESHVFKFADRVAIRFQCQIRLCMKADGGCEGITPPLCGSPSGGASVSRRSGSSGVRTNERLVDNRVVDEADGETNNGTDLGLNGSGNGNTTALRRLLRRYRRAPPAADGSGQPRVLDLDGFSPVDGDFTSQYIYVLDSTEEPKGGKDAGSGSALDKYLLRLNGAIVSDIRNSVCLSTGTFSVLLGSLALVFVAVTLIATTICCQRLRAAALSRKRHPLPVSQQPQRVLNGSEMDTLPTCYSSVRALWNQGGK